MPSAAVVGGGLAGMAAAAALAQAGFRVDLFEARTVLGGRASSFTPPDAQDGSELIDNCQHILLRCCANLLDFYGRLGALDRIRFYDAFHFVEPGGRVSTLRAGLLPAPWHLAGSFLRLRFLSGADKLAVVRGLAALRREAGRNDLDGITMMDWLSGQRQTPGAVRRFWQPVLASAVNEDLDRLAAAHAFQVFRVGFLGHRRAHELGVPTVPLGRLYERPIPGVELQLGRPVERVAVREGAATGVVVDGALLQADYIVLAVPPDRVPALVPELELDPTPFAFVPITGIHLWFDRPVMDLPQAALLDGALHWVFNKAEGRYLLAVVSASRGLVEMSRAAVISMARRELADHFPQARAARVERAHVVKELRATFSARPGLEAVRPGAETRMRRLFLAGDWTRTIWPATMEGAVRSGYLAAEAVTRAAGEPRRYVLPGI